MGGGGGEGEGGAVFINTVGSQAVGKGMKGWVIDTRCAEELGVERIVTRRSIIGSYISRVGGNCNRAAEVLFFNDTATTEIYTLSLHDALPICPQVSYMRA